MKLQNFDFRIWDKGEQTLIYASKDWKLSIGFSNPQQDNGETESVLHAYYDGEPQCPDDCEIELWSGFYDKNGAKIYESDIVRYDLSKRNLVVIWGENTYHIIYPDENLPLATQIFCGVRLQGIYENRKYKDNTLKCVEVVGNIHENAELLKETK